MAPELRLKSGDRVNVSVQNGLDAETTLHWHGIRIRNDMDGAAPTTQAPIGAGSQFRVQLHRTGSRERTGTTRTADYKPIGGSSAP